MLQRYRRASVRFVRVLVEAPSIPRRLSSCTEYWLGRSVESTLAVSERYIDCVSTCVTSMGVAQGAGRQDEGRQAPASASLHAGPHVDQQLVVGVETDEADAGELEVDDDVQGKRHGEREAHDMDPAPPLTLGQAAPCPASSELASISTTSIA